MDSVCGILFVVVCGVAVAVGGWWYCGFVCGVGVGGCVVLILILILMLVVFWGCKLVKFVWCYVSLIFQIWLKSLFLPVQPAKPD